MKHLFHRPAKTSLNIGFLVAAFFFVSRAFAQTPEGFGYRHSQVIFKKDTVHVLIKSRKGDEAKTKPLLLFCQGSLPKPLLIIYERGGKTKAINPFTFDTDSLARDYHLVIIGKPSVPLMVDEKALEKDWTYKDSTGQFPAGYVQRNLLDYYVNRNLAVLSFLQKQSWVAKNKLVVAGHSEGSTVAAKMALQSRAITHLVYASGNPMGRILSIVEKARLTEQAGDERAEREFQNWKVVVQDSAGINNPDGDTHKATYQFSKPPIDYLLRLKIPVFVCYGTKDYSAPFNDYLRVETIRQRKNNFSFKAYVGAEHNFFPVKANGEVDYDSFNWNKVTEEWRHWLAQH